MFPPLDTYLLTQVMFYLGTAAIIRESFWFTHDFFVSWCEFEHVVKELQMMIYIGSPIKFKSRPDMIQIKSLFSKNDEYRLEHKGNFMKGNEAMTVEALERPSLRHTKEAVDLGEDNAREENNAPDPKAGGRVNELDDIHIHQVVFNLMKQEGVLLFRRFRRFVRTDIFNELKEIESYVSVTVAVIVAMCIVVVCTALRFNGVTAICAVALYDIVILLCLTVTTLDTCVEANDCLFKRYEHVLLFWKEQTWDESSKFDPKDEEALAYIYDTATQNTKAVRRDKTVELRSKPRTSRSGFDDPEEELYDTVLIQEMRQVLNLAATMETRFEEKQKILGFELTKELRNRLLASVITCLLSLAGKNHAFILKLLSNWWWATMATLNKMYEDYLISVYLQTLR